MIKARKAYGDRVILDDVTLSFLPGAKIGVVGPNGMGKSTLLKIMAGLDTVSNGEAYLTPGFTVGILQQEPPLDDTKTVDENIKMAFGPIAEKVARFNQIGEEMANPDADFDALMEEMGKLQNDIDAANGWDLDSQLEQAMDALQCPDPDTPVSVCSGGERRRVALCKLLLEAPDLLLLDEPTNHLDAESILWLEQFLHQYKGAVIAVTHDRYFMDNVAEWICEVDRGHLYPYKGNYSTYLETKAKRLEIQGAKDAKLAKRLKNELEWVRSSPKARQAKNKARLAKFIDWMYSPEGIYASSSNSGGAACPKDLGCFTTDKDGKNPTLTKFGQQAMTGDHANLKVSAKLGGSSYDDGYSKLNFKAVSQNDIDPNTGEAYNPLLWKSNQDETELFKDWSAHMENATNDIDYLQKAGKLSIAAGASYTTPQEDSTVSATRSSVKSETVNASWQAITAAGKFEKTLDEARTKIDNLGYKEVLKVDQQNAKDLIQARKDIVKQAK